MKKVAVLCPLVLSLTMFSEAAVRPGLFGGYGKHLESNYGGGLAVGFSLACDLTPVIAVEVRAVRVASSVTGSTTGLSQGNMTVMPVELAVVVRFGAGKKLVPYIAVGGGYSFNTFKVNSTLVGDWQNLGMTLSESLKNGVTLLVGAGLDYALTAGAKPGQGLFLNIEARYLISGTDGTWSLTDAASGEKATAVLTGQKMDSLLVGLGLKYGF